MKGVLLCNGDTKVKKEKIGQQLEKVLDAKRRTRVGRCTETPSNCNQLAGHGITVFGSNS